MATLVLLRHGESVWNKENLFTGWVDCDLSPEGEKQARNAGRLLAEAGLRPDIVHTSVLKRAVRTANLTLEELDLLWIPATRHWRLNERHYGALQGLNKKATLERYGEEQFVRWRRGYDTPPPPLDADDERHPRFDPRYASLPPDVLPASECLKDVVERMLPYWYDGIVPDLAAGKVVLVAAHGNSLRALVKHLDGLDEEEVVGLNVPTGQPLVYELDDRMQPVAARYLDAEAAASAAEAVKNQGR